MRGAPGIMAPHGSRHGERVAVRLLSHGPSPLGGDAIGCKSRHGKSSLFRTRNGTQKLERS